MKTLADVIISTGKDVLDHLDRDAAVPTVSRQACQGDVSVLRVTTKPAVTPMPQMVVVVASEASSNTHTLHPNGICYWDAAKSAGLILGTLTVPEGSEAYLSHQEHGALLIAPGTYRIGRQREFSQEWRLVAD